MKNLKLIIIGYGRHGKDQFCEFLPEGYSYTSSSMQANISAVYPVLKTRYGYESPEECFEDRSNHRSEWYELIKEYNTPDLGRLGKEIFSKNEVYAGIRDRDEFYTLKEQGVFDYAIWVDASERLEGLTEGKDSMNIVPEDADYVVFNNGTLEEFELRVRGLIRELEEVKSHEEIGTDGA